MRATIACAPKIGITPRPAPITAWEIDDLTGIGPYSVYPRNLRHRGQPGGEPRGRPLHLQKLPGARPPWCSRTRNVMCQLPRRRPSDRDPRHREAWSNSPPRASAWTPLELRPPQPHPGRRLSGSGPVGHPFREAIAPRGAGASRRHDEPTPACAPRQARLRECGIYRGIGLLLASSRLTNPSAAFLRHRRRPYLGPGWRHRAARRHRCGVLPYRRHRTGPGRRGRDRPMRGVKLRGADRARARHHRRHRQTCPMAAAPGRRAPRAGIGGEGGPGRPARRCGRTCWPWPARLLQAEPASLDIRGGVVVDAGQRPASASALDEIARIAYFRPDTFAARLPGRARRHPPLRAESMAVRLHQRHPGEPRGGR